MMKESEKLIKRSVHEDNLFMVHYGLVLMTAKETITWMKDKNYFHHWLPPINIFQGETPYYGCPVVNRLELIPLDNNSNRDILHSLRFHCVLSRFVLDGEVTDEEESNMRFSLSTPK